MRQTKRVISALLFFSLYIPIYGQSPERLQDNITKAFDEYKAAVLQVDIQTIMKMTPQHIIEIGGGAGYFVDDLYEEYNAMSKSGIELRDMVVLEVVKMKVTDKWVQALVYVEKKMRKATASLDQQGYYLGISEDKGAKWYFLDMTKYDSKDIKLFVPTIDEDLSHHLLSISH